MTHQHEGAEDWNSTVYHRVAAPQLAWGSDLVESVDFGAPHVVLDIGCGTGRVTHKLIERLPGARVVAVDLSPAMVDTAKNVLSAYAGRVNVVQADAVALPFGSA